MKLLAILVSAFLILLSISGCASKDVYINVPQKCVVPTTPYPELNTAPTKDILEATKQCASNYFKMKEYSEKLLENSKVCQ